MAYPHLTTRVLAAFATAAAVATPALAADESGNRGHDALRVMAPTAPAAIQVRRERLARVARQQIATREARQNPGPFVPVVGDVDYGTTENAYGAARSGHVHAGHDMFAPSGTPLVAVADGVIAEVGSDGGQGNYVYLYDQKRDQTYIYMHLVAPAQVGVGDTVSAGEQLGGVGCTGSCWGEHLHFEIRAGKGIVGEPHDPLPELERWDRIKKPL